MFCSVSNDERICSVSNDEIVCSVSNDEIVCIVSNYKVCRLISHVVCIVNVDGVVFGYWFEMITIDNSMDKVSTHDLIVSLQLEWLRAEHYSRVNIVGVDGVVCNIIVEGFDVQFTVYFIKRLGRSASEYLKVNYTMSGLNDFMEVYHAQIK